jgi:hypothetical protein
MTLPTSLFSRVVTFRSLALVVVLALVGAGLLGSPAQAQDEGEGESSQIVAQVSYMKAEPGEVGKYLNLEREIWKPIHQERMNDGKILRWSLYSVRYPGGTGHDYNYVTVTFHESRADVENPEFGTYAERAHPDKNLSVLFERMYDARELVRSELWTRVDRLVPEDPQSGPAPFLQVDYMKVEPTAASDYVSLEQDVWKPVHQARVDAGMMSRWALWAMTLPHGTGQPYNFAAVNGYQSMADMGGYPENVWEEVHPDRNVEKIVKRTTAARDNVQGELWELVDSVPAADSNP